MKLNSLLGVGLVAGGGYFLLKYLGYDPLSFLTPATTTQNNNGTSPQANQQTQTIDATLQSLINTLIDDHQDPASFQSADYWNFYYAKVRGIPGPSPTDLFPTQGSGYKMSITEWWAAMKGKGFSGLACGNCGMHGLGCPTLCNAAWGGMSGVAPRHIIGSQPIDMGHGRASGIERMHKVYGA